MPSGPQIPIILYVFGFFGGSIPQNSGTFNSCARTAYHFVRSKGQPPVFSASLARARKEKGASDFLADAPDLFFISLS